ncbi:hypothetical protein [Burkholderia sp. FERM BP-3421]|uniref:hypothetical protein n=1 Tax=Burkholderia sp. FERM BP-3421 TaxID=1494466 RepID=UPI0030823944
MRGIDGPLFLGIDTHALAEPAQASVLEVRAANGVVVMLAPPGEYTPAPAVSRAILKYNRGRSAGFANGIVVMPSRNPPDSGGIKYNPPTGGPAGEDITRWIDAAANGMLEAGLAGVSRVSLSKALNAATTHWCNFLAMYIDDLTDVMGFFSSGPRLRRAAINRRPGRQAVAAARRRSEARTLPMPVGGGAVDSALRMSTGRLPVRSCPDPGAIARHSANTGQQIIEAHRSPDSGQRGMNEAHPHGCRLARNGLRHACQCICRGGLYAESRAACLRDKVRFVPRDR